MKTEIYETNFPANEYRVSVQVEIPTLGIVYFNTRDSYEDKTMPKLIEHHLAWGFGGGRTA